MANLLTVILAAGKGTRMKSGLTKVLHRVAGKPMVGHVIDNARQLDSEIVLVIGHQADKVRKTFAEEGLSFVEQKEQLGTGHAVMQARGYIDNHEGPVLVLYGDTPLLTGETLSQVIKTYRKKEAAAVVLTAIMDDPYGYGRIVKNENNLITRIVEEDDATPHEREIKEINSGVYCFDSKLLSQAIKHLDNDNAQGEYYLTDVISIFVEKGEKVVPYPVKNLEEIIGVNDRVNLAKAEKIIRGRVNQQHMQQGVTIIDPATTYIDSEVEIGQDTVIYPFTYLQGKTKIGPKSVIGPHCQIVNSNIAGNVELKANSIILESEIASKTTVGPFAYIRPGTKVADGAKVGDFVELKKAKIGPGSKVPHLSYVGDAEIGANTNIGAGTIFANYDGKHKHKTTVGDSCFIGSNSTLVAPVNIGDKGKTGAGAVVTKDVPEKTTVIGVPARPMKKKGGSKDS